MSAIASAQLTDEQRGLQDAVRGLLSRRSDTAAVRRVVESDPGHDTALWRTLCEQIGVAALGIDERFDGLGAGARETGIVCAELGRNLTPSPMLGSAVHAARFLQALGDEDAAARLLPRIAAGAVVAVAGVAADGAAHHVLDGDIAESVLLVHDGHAYEAELSGAVRTHTPTMDLTRRLARVEPVAGLGTPLEGDAAAALKQADAAACTALAAEQVGAAGRLLELTVEYTLVRKQFGRAIGSFQALKHRMADLHVRLEAARSAVWAAEASALHPSVAKSCCSEAFMTIAAEAIQLHGGIAITWEHDAHLYFKRAHGSGELFGSAREHIERLAAELP